MNKGITFEPLRRLQFPKEIVRTITARIADGQISSGTKLPPERVLATQFGVSRPTVREALHVLEALGVVRVHHGSGAYIVNQSLPVWSPLLGNMLENDMQILFEIFEYRCELEVRNAELAAENATIEELSCLEVTLSKMKEDLLVGGLGFQQDLDFHRVVAQASHNRVRLFIANSLFQAHSDLIRRVREKIVGGNRGFADVFVRELENIRLGIEQKDPAAAGAAMRIHLMACVDRYRYFLENSDASS